MKEFVKIGLLMSGLILLPSCGGGGGGSDEPDKPDVPKPVEKKEIKINVSASSSLSSFTGFKNADKVGLYVVDYLNGSAQTLGTSGNHLNNVRFTYSGSWSADSKYYWTDASTRADFYVYYPYSTITSVNSLSFDVAADQSTESAFRASAFLAGKATNVAPTTSAVSITANHVMSELQIELVAGKGVTAEELASSDVSVKIKGLQTQMTYNLSSMTIVSKDNANDIIPMRSGATFRAMVIPQEVTDADLVTVIFDGEEFTLKSSMKFESGKVHKLTVPIEETTGGISVGITSWGDGGEHGGTAI